MSQIALEQSLLKAIDEYIDNGTNISDMQQIAHSLNMLPSISSKMRICFYSLLSDLDHTRIRKTLDMLEYLTIFSPPKVLQIINDDKFMENIAQALMEYYLQDQALNLLKLWIDEFADSQDEIKLVKALAENLEPFEIHLPSSYQSKYKNAAAAGESVVVEIRDNQNAEMRHDPFVFTTSLPPKVSVLVDKAKEVMDNITRFLESPDFESLTQEDKRKKLHLLMAQNLEVTSDFTDLKIPSYEYDAIEKIDEEVEKLKNYRIKLHEKLDQVQRGGITPQSQQQPQSQADAHYKIVVSETDLDQASNENSQVRMMELEELLSYKTSPCDAGAVCNHAPVHGKRVNNHSLYTHEMHCTGWHNPSDRRRPVYDDNYRAMYNYVICDDGDTCFMNDACGFAHNFFESAYHPLHYKKKKCRFAKTCKNEKYCPDYHTTEEKESWENIAKQYFESVSGGNSLNHLGDDNPNPILGMIEPGAPVKNPEELQMHDAEDDPVPVGPPVGGHQQKEFHTGPVYGRSAFGKNFPRYNPNQVGFKQYQEPEEPAQPKGTLHSKLVIRKKYEEPGTLTSFFQKSPIFGSLPFVTSSPSVTVEHAKTQVNVDHQEGAAEHGLGGSLSVAEKAEMSK